MNLLKPFLPLVCSILYLTNGLAQNTTTVRQEFSISPTFVFGGAQDVPTAEGSFKEQGSGFGLSAGYTVLFGWAGIAFNFYSQSTDPNTEAIKDRFLYDSVISGNYQSNGFMGGIDLNVPLTKRDFKTYVHLGFLAGGFMAHLPEQEFVYSNDENYKFLKMKNAGLAFRSSIGLKADLTSRFALSLDFDGLYERAVVPRESFGSIESTEFYRWNFNYSLLKLNMICKF